MSDQHALFPYAPKEPKRKAKTLPKQVQLPAAAPAKKLSPNAELERSRNLASVRKERAKWKVGDIRMADDNCPECGGERIEELIGIETQGGLTWERRCLECCTSL